MKTSGKSKVTRGYERPDGYWASFDGLGKKYLKHRLVWKIHNGEIPKGMDVHHIDGNKSNNNIENLELVSKEEHAKKHRKEKINDIEILSLRLSGLTLHEISALVGMGHKGSSVWYRLETLDEETIW